MDNLTEEEAQAVNKINHTFRRLQIGDRLRGLESGLKTVAVNVSAGNANGSSAADPELVGGTPIGVVPAGNQDQFVDNVVVGSDGKVTVTLAANATAQNQFEVTVLIGTTEG